MSRKSFREHRASLGTQSDGFQEKAEAFLSENHEEWMDIWFSGNVLGADD